MPKKRPDGRYYTSVIVDYDPDTGKPIKEYVYALTLAEFNQKKDEAKQKQKDNEKKRELGYDPNLMNVTFYDYALNWLETKSLEIEMNTIKMYKSVLNNYTSTILDKRICDIKKKDIQDIITKAAEHPRTCQKIKVTFNQIFEDAIDDEIIIRNPCRRLKLPIYDAKEKRMLTDDEDILSDCSDFTDRQRAFVWLIKYFGLRKEEALALEKSDFDFVKDQLSISKALAFITNSKTEIKGTKNGTTRILPIPAKVKRFFVYYISNLNHNRLITNVRNNKIITETGYRRLFETIINCMRRKSIELGINGPCDDLTAHIFRHNYACMLMFAGVEMKERQYLLGHKTITMTYNIYTHIEVDKMMAASKLRTYLGDFDENRIPDYLRNNIDATCNNIISV